MTWDEITFGDTRYFLLGLVVLVLLLGTAWLYVWRRRAREAFAGPRSRSWPSLAFWPRSIFLLAAATLLVIAAARPQWGSEELVREVSGIDLVIVLDISQSMTADDVSPSRMAVAQSNLTTLVESQRGSRFGLVFFAGSAFLRSPLTSDTQAMNQLIQRADREAGLTRVGSDLGAALAQAGVILSRSENSGRAVVLVSDGEDHGGTFEAEAQALVDEGVAIYTAGVGTPEGARLFDIAPDGTLVPKTDASGPIISSLQPDSLRSIAQIGGGEYVHLDGGSTTALLGFQNELSRLDRTPLGTETEQIPIERYQYFVAAALVLLLLSWITPSRLPGLSFRGFRPGRRPALAALLLAVLIGGCTEDSLRQRNEAANDLYNAGAHEEALAEYQELISERPDVDEFSYNAGNALHRLRSYERAVTETQRALPPLDPQLGAWTYYALGNHLLGLQRLEEAYVAYRNALLLDANDQDAKHNLELALLLMEQRDNPPEPGEGPPEGPGEGEGEGPPEGEGEQPGEGGQGDPADPGEGSGAGEGEQDPGEGDPGAGSGEASPDGEGEDGEALSGEALQRALEEALAGIDEELTFEEAVEILDLLRRQQERQLPSSGGGSGPDY